MNCNVYVADIFNVGIWSCLVEFGKQGFYDFMRDVGIIDANCMSEIPVIILPSHGFVGTLEQVIQDLTDFGVDVGCS